MKKILLFISVGLALSLGSIYIFYLFLISLSDNSNFLILGVSMIMLISGVFLLMHASKPNVSTVEASESSGETKPGFEGILERNNSIAQEWNKTIKQRDQLKMLEISENAKASSE